MDESESEEESYPDWWRRNADTFREHGLPAYRPPRFEDDELVPPVVDGLEEDLGVEVRLRVVDPQEGNQWEVLVDEAVAGRIDRHRHVDGYTLFHTTSEEFATLVRDEAEA